MRVIDCKIYPNEVVPVTPVLGYAGYALERGRKTKDGFNLPPWWELVRKDWGVDRLRTTDEWFKIIVAVKYKKHTMQYKFSFNEEWITDLASVPAVLRGIVDNDEQWIIPPSQVHDALFCYKGFGSFSFAQTNRLFYEMCKYYVRRLCKGFRKFRMMIKAWLAYIAVSTPVGKRRWKMKRDDWEKQGCEYRCEKLGFALTEDQEI